MGTPLGWGLEHRASNPVSIKNLTAIRNLNNCKVGGGGSSSSSSSSSSMLSVFSTSLPMRHCWVLNDVTIKRQNSSQIVYKFMKKKTTIIRSVSNNTTSHKTHLEHE
jgi:hypothetical protein